MGGEQLRLNDVWNAIIKGNAGISEQVFLGKEFERFKYSVARKNMQVARRYYLSDQDIKNKRRTDAAGVELLHLPNNKIMDNKFDDLVDQKVNYLLSKPMEVKTEDKEVKELFNNEFLRRLKSIGRNAMICGISYLYPYLDDNGHIQFQRMNGDQVVPFWRDEEHTVLDAFLYFYNLEVYNVNGQCTTVTKVEYYHPDGVKYFKWDANRLAVDNDKEDHTHVIINGKPMNWNKIPLIPFKLNEFEHPLILRVKCLQDALNMLMSSFADNMEEDVHSTILVIKNYDGTDLSSFRKNLAAYGAVKIKTVDGIGGDVETLRIEVNSDNYEAIIKLLKKAIMENGRGFDSKDERMSNNPNQMNINSMYSDIDLDANDMEIEFQASLELLMKFVEAWLGRKVDVEFIFNRDLPLNQADAINNCKNSIGVISKETVIANHPWTQNTADELKRIKEEEAQLIDDYVEDGGAGDDT